ncbi:MAG: hypothetical protein ACTSQA_04010 [Candidatus Heimdallarchaeaceae archaeon]
MNEETDLETPKTPEGENPEETKVEETEEPEKSKVEKPEQSKELQSALAQKEHQREKREQAEKELAKLKETKSNIPASQNPMEVVKLAKALEGYSEEEVEFITRNSTDKSIDGIINASKDDWVKTAIQAKREKVAKENKTPEPSTKQDFSEKPVEDITEEELAAMPLKKKEEYLRKIGWIK